MTKEKLIPGSTCHIYNHANRIENLFLSDENFNYFLRRYTHFIEAIADTYAFCLSVFTYILSIPVEHRIVKKMEDWSHNSIHAYLTDRPSKIKISGVLKHFEDKDALIQFLNSYKLDLSSYFDF
jgi:hypothetical protein